MSVRMAPQTYDLWLAEQNDEGDIVAGRVIGWVAWTNTANMATVAAAVVAYSAPDGAIYETRRAYGLGDYVLSPDSRQDAEKQLARILAGRSNATSSS